ERVGLLAGGVRERLFVRLDELAHDRDRLLFAQRATGARLGGLHLAEGEAEDVLGDVVLVLHRLRDAQLDVIEQHDAGVAQIARRLYPSVGPSVGAIAAQNSRTASIDGVRTAGGRLARSDLP